MAVLTSFLAAVAPFAISVEVGGRAAPGAVVGQRDARVVHLTIEHEGKSAFAAGTATTSCAYL